MGRVLSAKRAVLRARRISIGIAVTVGALATGIALAPASGAAGDSCVSVQGVTFNVGVGSTCTSTSNPGSFAIAQAADQLEGLGTRLQAVVSSSDRLRGSDALTQAIAAFQGTVPSPPAVTTYNRAVRDYENERNGLLRGPVASLFGYDSRPQLLLSS